jgi:chemotaxis response regulator CheB
VIAQDPDTCAADDMPRNAILRGVDFILPPERIPRALIGLVAVPGVAAMFGVGRYRSSVA